MNDEIVFAEVIQSADELRAILGHPSQHVIDKVIHEIDEYAAEFIARSPFILVGSSDAQGNHDVSPKGDPPGFVQVLNSRTLLIAVTVEDVYFHCAKCIIRSKLWDEGAAQQELTSLADVMIKYAHMTADPETFQRDIDESYKKELY
jgi:predicted pyridoxine 5'-phosphate oxidase superfamily flavin-nucleotide-binding protein